MGNSYVIDKSKYIIDKNKAILVETIADDYVTCYVYYSNDDDITYIGCFDLYNYSSSRDYLIYNDKFIGIRSENSMPHSVNIVSLYDLEDDCFIKKNNTELVELFNLIFKNGPCEKLIHNGVYSSLKNTKRIGIDDTNKVKFKSINE